MERCPKEPRSMVARIRRMALWSKVRQVLFREFVGQNWKDSVQFKKSYVSVIKLLKLDSMHTSSDFVTCSLRKI